MLSPDEALLLDRLTLGANPGAVTGSAAGVRRTPTRGAGVEFHEYRAYQAGDDLRAVDWTVEARLRQLVVRVSRAEGHVRLHLLIDTSASMGIGNPTKLACATRVAAALAYAAVERRDALGVSAFCDRITTYIPPAEGRTQLFRALEMLTTMASAGASKIDHALEHYAAAAKGPGLVAVLSDYFEPGSGMKGLQCLLYRGLTPIVLQIAAPEEVTPDLVEDTELFDIEDSAGGPVVVNSRMVAAYRDRLVEHRRALQTFCAAHGCAWAAIASNSSFRQILAALEASRVLGTRA